MHHGIHSLSIVYVIQRAVKRRKCMKSRTVVSVLLVLVAMLAATPASAGPILEGLERLFDHPQVERNDQAVQGSEEQITGVPGSASATITIDGKQLPPPPQKFEGKIGRTTAESKPYWPARVVPPKGAPNILLIMTDDAGYGVASTFGGVIPTPALDRIAANGLRYTNFHSTALCSPTRAALITGRNHHSVG